MRKLIISFIAALSLAALPAYADRDHGRGHYGHSDRGGGDGAVLAGLAIFGAIAGLAILADRNSPPHAAPAYVEPAYAPQPIYSEPPRYSTPAPVTPDSWYYCQSSAMYYPYTNACPEGWQVLPIRPN